MSVNVNIVDTTPRPRSTWGRRLRMAFVVGSLMLTSACGAPVVGGGDTMEVVAYFEDSAGLFVGNDVGVLGVDVGKVTAIEPDGDRVKVTMEVDADQKYPADAQALVVARSVATDRYIELSPVYSGKGPTLEDGAEIEKTASPVDFDQVLESLNAFATGIAGSKKTTKAVQNFINNGTAALDGNGPILNQAIHALAEGVNGINSTKDDLAATIRSLDVLLQAIAADEGTARTFIQQVAKASDLLASERENFRTALRALDRAVTTVAEFAVDNRAELVEGIDGATELIRTIVAKQDSLIEVLRVMPLGLQNLQRAVRNGRLQVQADPLTFLPLGDILIDLCDDAVPLELCDLLSTDPLGGGLLGRQGVTR